MGMIRSTEPDFLPGTLEMLILQTLSRGANHGYGIAQDIQQISNDALKIGEGSLYPALQRLPINDYVVAEWGVPAFHAGMDPADAPEFCGCVKGRGQDKQHDRGDRLENAHDCSHAHELFYRYCNASPRGSTGRTIT